MTQEATEFEEVFGKLLEDDETIDPPADEPAAPDADEPDAVPAGQDNQDPAEPTGDEPAPDSDEDPGQGDPDAPAGSDAPDGEAGIDLEELKKRAHGYDSMLGRLEQERNKVKSLEQQLASMQQPPAQQSPAPAQDEGSAPSATLSDIPEDIREDVEAFQKSYPGYARMITDGGEVGKSLRHLLMDYGPEVAAIQARSVDLENRLMGSLQNVQQQTARVQALSHQERILSDNNDLAQVAEIGDNGQFRPMPGKEQQFREFFTGLNEWVQSRPYAEATRWLDIQKQGTPAQVGELLNAYRTYRTSSRASASHGDRLDKARAAGTVPSRTPSIPAGEPDPDDFEGNFGPLIGL